jgi:hypothetical protein
MNVSFFVNALPEIQSFQKLCAKANASINPLGHSAALQSLASQLPLLVYHIEAALAKLPPYDHSQLYRGIQAKVEGYEGRRTHRY